MDIKKFLENTVGITGNDTSHNGRYINFDGTPYGSKGLARVMLSPGLSANIGLLGLSISPYLLMGRTEIGCKLMIAGVAKLAAIDILTRTAINRFLNKNGSIIIDRQGEGSKIGQNLKILGKYEIAKNGSLYGSLPFSLINTGMGLYVCNYAFLCMFARSRIKSGKWMIVEPPAPRVRKPKEAKVTHGKLQPAFG